MYHECYINVGLNDGKGTHETSVKFLGCLVVQN
jgi:hypothetical protein